MAGMLSEPEQSCWCYVVLIPAVAWTARQASESFLPAILLTSGGSRSDGSCGDPRR